MMTRQTPPYEVAVYYFPQFHIDARNEQWHGRGWTEWEMMKHATPRFDGHRQPIVPSWGYFDEADPRWAAREIDLAADHGITTFLYDWYWYDGQPFLHDALERGFLQAPNSERLNFALMWANHDWINFFPMRFTNMPELLAEGKLSQSRFEAMTDYVIDRYFTHPSYLRIDGAPYFSIWDIGMLIAGLGGMVATATALERFAKKVRQRGFTGLHLNVIDQNIEGVPDEAHLAAWSRSVASPRHMSMSRTSAVNLNPIEAVKALGIASATPYNWMQHLQLDRQGPPQLAYAELARANYHAWEAQQRRLPVTFFPNVMQGWDVTPRTAQSDTFALGEYPWWPVITDNTPQAFGEALRQAKTFLDRSSIHPRLLTINAWNEWTEGSYLLPDTDQGLAYLEAIHAVFPPRE